MNPLRTLFLSLSRLPVAVLLFIVLGLGVLGFMMVTGEINRSQQEASQREAELRAKLEQKAKVVYAIKDIPEGATISADSLEERETEAGKVPEDALPSTTMAIGRIAKYGIPANQVVSSHDLAPLGVSLGFDARIKAGYRAVTFAVDTNSGVAGFIIPGSHVDVLGVAGSAEKTKVKPILSDIEVTAVGTIYQKPTGTAAAVPTSSVTVSVTPDQANKLVKGLVAGKLYLTLRNQQDHSPIPVSDITDLFEKQSTALASMPSLPPPPLSGMRSPLPMLHTIELWSGSKKEVLSVPKT